MLIPPGGYAQRGAEAANHEDERRHGCEPPGREAPERRAERDGEPGGRQVERAFGDQDLSGKEQVRYRRVGDGDPTEAERLHLASPPPRPAEEERPEAEHEHSEHQAAVEQSMHGSALIGRIVRAQRERKHQQAGHIREGRNGR